MSARVIGNGVALKSNGVSRLLEVNQILFMDGYILAEWERKKLKMKVRKYKVIEEH